MAHLVTDRSAGRHEGRQEEEPIPHSAADVKGAAGKSIGKIEGKVENQTDAVRVSHD